MDRPVLDLTWDYPVKGEHAEPDAEAVLAEINGRDAAGKPLSAYTQLADDGSTTCGCWIYCGVYADGVNQAARRKPGQEQTWVAPEWAWAWPANWRILYNRASADPEGKPWSERKAYVWWDPDQGRWTGHDIPDFEQDKPPHYRPPEDATGPGALSGADPFIMQADGKAWLFAPAGLVDGPLPAHDRMTPLTVQGRRLHQVGLPYHWGPNGYSTGDPANDLPPVSLDPNVHIQGVKAFACDIRPGRRPRGPARMELVREYQRRAGITESTGTEI